MKILSELAAGREEVAQDWQERRGIVAAVLYEPVPGVLVQVALGSAGLKVSRGDVVVAITLAELAECALRHEPRLGEKA